MAYVYQVSFDIQPDQMSQLEIGASLERTAGYLRTLLPNETGFISTHAMYSLDVPDKTQLLVQTWWETWEDLTAHGKSSLAEDKVLSEFEPHLSLHHLTVHVYEEVA
jgi:heme-degrading monooxygenase HmoA